ncbi:MAG: capsid protein [Pavo cristatus parvo-like hybrid virus]|nr:MAG: capsid protein [Pavo cristatus parvo-like hybrid virus]
MGRKEKRKSRDWTLPGTNYVGPGNKLHKGPPRHHNDRVAQIHDFDYDTIIDNGGDPYWQYSDADERARKQFDHSHYSGTLGKAFFTAKKAAWKTGFIKNVDELSPTQKKVAQRKGAFAKTDVSLNNLQSQANMNDGGRVAGRGSGNPGTLKETPVDNEPEYLETGPEDYTFAKLPYYTIKNFYGGRYYAADLAFRMTSPYDPEVLATSGLLSGAASTGVIAPNASDPDGGTNPKANWFEFYAGMYKYYHVTKCTWSMYIENTGGEPLYVHQMYYNDELPPQGATNTDIMAWSGVRTRILQPQFKAIGTNGAVSTAEAPVTVGDLGTSLDESSGDTGSGSNYSAGNNIASRIGSSTCQFSGSYRPGQFRREVNLDSQVENWTLVSTNPTLPERLLFRFKPENPALVAGLSRGDQISFKAFFKAEYVVEFKELQPGLRWPVQRQPMLVTIQANQFANTS